MKTTIIETPPLHKNGYPYNESEVTAFDTEKFIKTNFDERRIHHLSRNSAHLIQDRRDPKKARIVGGAATSLGFQAVHTAFAMHIPLSLSPDLVWYLIVHETAIAVHQNAEKYRHLFTQAAGKTTIEVQDNSLVYGSERNKWGDCINLFRSPLRQHLTEETAELFLPQFSTGTPETETAILLTLMDVASDYFDYRVSTLCGIPKIRLEGGAEDWIAVVKRTFLLREQFPELRDYFYNLDMILSQFVDATFGRRTDERFWRSIYKIDGGSGGDRITGWITAFLAYTRTENGFVRRKDTDWQTDFQKGSWAGLTADQFPAHVSKIPFVWQYYEQKIPMTFGAGIFGIDLEDGFLVPKLGFGVFE